MSSGSITFSAKTKMYDRAPYEPVVKVTAFPEGKKTLLTEGIDYEKSVYGTEHQSMIEVTITGKGNFTGTMKKDVKKYN